MGRVTSPTRSQSGGGLALKDDSKGSFARCGLPSGSSRGSIIPINELAVKAQGLAELGT